MSDKLKPCPVCFQVNYRVSISDVYCACGFRCIKEYWNKLPRTEPAEQEPAPVELTTQDCDICGGVHRAGSCAKNQCMDPLYAVERIITPVLYGDLPSLESDMSSIESFMVEVADAVNKLMKDKS